MVTVGEILKVLNENLSNGLQDGTVTPNEVSPYFWRR